MIRLRTLQSKREEIEKKGTIRSIIFGMQDGLISIVSLMAGIAGATGNDKVSIILAGITAAIAGALSMGTGEYLSSKSEVEIFEFEKKRAHEIIDTEPYVAKEGLLESLVREGLTREKAYTIVRELSDEEKIFRSTFSEKVLGLGEAEISQPIRAALAISFAFILASLIPITPYFFFLGYLGVFLSILGTSVALYLIGALKGQFAGLNIWISGLEFFIIAFSSAIFGYFIGDFLGPILTSL